MIFLDLVYEISGKKILEIKPDHPVLKIISND